MRYRREMTNQTKSRQSWYSLKISEIPRIDDRSFDVVASRTGAKLENLPREAVQFLPGRVLVPEWLVKKRLDLRREIRTFLVPDGRSKT
ncbi:MAG: hypothetical protein RBT11_19675 [Desulfobacterales bacterium]|jgi:hypothetical protein|nr:hypothetical protein [Desulfobacterales bacterium]